MRRRWMGAMLGVAVLLGVGALGAGALAEDTSPVQAEAESGLPTWEQVAAKVGLQGEAAALVGEDLGRALGLEPILLPTDACPGLFVEFRDQEGFCLIPVQPKLSFAEEMILAARIQGHVMTDAEVARMVENFDTLSPDTVAEVGPLLP
jgi:hypothetical protein